MRFPVLCSIFALWVSAIEASATPWPSSPGCTSEEFQTFSADVDSVRGDTLLLLNNNRFNHNRSIIELLGDSLAAGNFSRHYKMTEIVGVDNQVIRSHLDGVMQLTAGTVAQFHSGPVLHDAVKNGVLADLSDLFTDPQYGLVGKIPAPLRGACQKQGILAGDENATYCVPVGGYAIVLFYNKRLLDEAGVRYPFETWTEVQNAFLRLVAHHRPRIPDFYPVSFAGDMDGSAWYMCTWLDYLSMRMFGPEFHLRLMTGEIDWAADPRPRRVFTEWADLVRTAVHPLWWQRSWPTIFADIVSRRSAFALSGDYVRTNRMAGRLVDPENATRGLETTKRFLAEDMGWQRFPIIDPAVPIGEDVPIDAWLLSRPSALHGVPEAEERVQAGKRVIAALMSQRAHQILMDPAGAGLDVDVLPTSSRTDILPADDVTAAQFDTVIAKADMLLQFYDRNVVPAFNTPSQRIFHGFLRGNLTLDFALQSLEALRQTVYIQRAPVPLIYPPPGHYVEPISVTLILPIDELIGTTGTIYYTVDGSVPTVASSRYVAPVNVVTSATVRAMSIVPGLAPSDITGASYVFPMADDVWRIASITSGSVAAACILLIGIVAGCRVWRNSVRHQATLRKQKAAEELLITQRNVAEARTAARTAFVSRMSHELRTPLHVILGYGQLLRETFQSAEVDATARRSAKQRAGNTISAQSELLHAGSLSNGPLMSAGGRAPPSSAGWSMPGSEVDMRGSTRDSETVVPPQQLQEEYVEQMMLAASQLLELVNDVLDISRVDTGTQQMVIESVDVGTLVEQVALQLEPIAQSRRVVIFSNVSEGTVVQTDRRCLRQVVCNILANAVKYNRPGGRIDIASALLPGEPAARLSCTPVESPRSIFPTGSGAGQRAASHSGGASVSTPSSVETLPRLVLSFSDTGYGIPADALGRVFDMFERIHTRHYVDVDGAGIGLAIVRRLTEALGGTARVASTVGVGTTFSVILPLTCPDFVRTRGVSTSTPTVSTTTDGPTIVHASRPRGATLPHHARPRFHGKVLQVEDSPANIRLMECALASQRGLVLLTEVTGTDGLARAVSDPPDLILQDLHLPDMSGFDVLRALRANPQTAHIPCIAVTAAAMQQDVDAMVAAGFDAVLTKPFTRADLWSLLSQFLSAAPRIQSAAPDTPMGKPQSTEVLLPAGPVVPLADALKSSAKEGIESSPKVV
eukprot:TRINITY_DN67792_c0_g1_i1.p1 TRINITY_DN67792_c0_g1~~TRINITY_DN67792_c0_g1_i1.p1  ORF type:complete len:1202 (+),score=219.01 TRINITY_DN67792_c0_g1_i1:268-3873(+)